MKDEVTVGIDTSGDSLHKRGYRLMTSKAPVTETLAAALILLTPWKKDRILVDPFCGSGTFPIEAAMMAADIAPGMKREFTAEKWGNLIERKLWYEGVEEAEDLIQRDITAAGQPAEPSEEIRICHLQSALRGTAGRKRSPARPLRGTGRGHPAA